MHSRRDPSPGAGHALTERSLQQGDSASEPVPPEWLIEVDAADEARDVDRLQGDSDLLLQLQLASYEGEVWDYFSEVLARYGFAVVRAWLMRGVMVQKCKEKGLQGLPRNGMGQLPYDEAAEVAGETVAVAIHNFRERVLRRNLWDPRRGASLRTFFVGQCLIQFPSVYRRWRDEDARKREDPLEETDEASHDDPEQTAVQRAEVDNALAEVDDRTAQVLRLYADDVPQEEIAERIGGGMTARAVHGILYRHRKRQRREDG